jgi:hypothetical protein
MISPRPKTFSEIVHSKEIWLRGFHLSVACDMEYVLTDIICTCLASTAKQREEFKINFFENVSFARKLTLAKNILEKDFPEDYKYNEDVFEGFKKLRERRNFYAHARISGDPEGKDESLLVSEFIKDGKMVQQTHVFQELEKEILEFKSKVNKLLALVIVIYNKKRLM